ncbi:twin-arginine translocase TatA/TatE family subunit [Thermodesulfobacteriota bacterium]
MFGLGATELIVIGVIIFLLFGAKRIPEIGKGLGDSIREFKKVKKEMTPIESVNKNKDGDTIEDKSNTGSIEGKLARKVMEQVPGVRTVMDINDKVNKVKEVIK